jgi:hypothetical protein
MSTATLNIIPTDEGTWVVKDDDSSDPPIGITFICASPMVAIAQAIELAKDHDEARVNLFTATGRIQTALLIHHYHEPDDDDPAARAEALRMMPSFDRLKAGIGKHPLPAGDFGDEEMAC